MKNAFQRLTLAAASAAALSACAASGSPAWDARFGDRLRQWLGLSREQFYDPRKIALVPMGFCYPGSNATGDLPPRPECAPLWHPRILTDCCVSGMCE